MDTSTASTVPLEPVTSSHLGAIGYDYARRILAVQFHATGTIYHYADVDPNEAHDFYQAESKGKFYAERVKGKYQGERMTGPCASCGLEGYGGQTCEDCGTATHVVPPMKERAS